MKYDEAHVEDEFGGLGDQPLDLDDFAPFEIDRALFDAAWSTKSRIGTVEYAASFLPYFSNQAKTEASFRLEMETAERVVALMCHREPDLAAIVREMREIEAARHYNGTGWHGFKTAVRTWLEARGGTL